MCTWYKYFPEGSRRACPGRRDGDPYNYADVTVNRYNLYARRKDRDNEAARQKKLKKKKEDEWSIAVLKQEICDREWRRVVIYDGNRTRRFRRGSYSSEQHLLSWLSFHPELSKSSHVIVKAKARGDRSTLDVTSQTPFIQRNILLSRRNVIISWPSNSIPSRLKIVCLEKEKTV